MRFKPGRLAQHAEAQPGELAPIDGRKSLLEHRFVIGLPAGVFDHRIEVKAQTVAGLLTEPRRVQSFAERCGAMLVEIDDPLRIHRPADDDPALGIEIEQAFDAIAFGFELEQNVRLLGEIRNQFADHAGVRLKRKTIGDLTGADAEKNAAMARQRTIRFGDQVARRC